VGISSRQNKNGYEKNGYNSDGTHKRTGTKFDENGFNKNHIHKETGTEWDENGYDDGGYNVSGFNIDGFHLRTRTKLNLSGFDKDGEYFTLVRSITDGTTDGYDKDGIFKSTGTEYHKDGYDIAGYDREGYDREGYDISRYDKNGYNKEGYDKNGIFESTGTSYARDGYNVDGVDKEGYDRAGYNREGYDRDGYDIAGYDKSGYNKDGYDREGYDIAGYDKYGYKDGYNKFGFNKDGYNREGYDREGYDIAGYYKDGYNKEGYDKEGIFESTGTKYDKDGYDKDGYNNNGYNRDGIFESTGTKYGPDGYDKYGYNRDGYNRDGIFTPKIESNVTSSKYPLYHSSLIENLQSILSTGILSHDLSMEKKPERISNPEIVKKRGDIILSSGYSLHHYANFYFRASNAMLYERVKFGHERGIITENIIVFEIKVDFNHDDVFVSDGNCAVGTTALPKPMPAHNIFESIDEMKTIPRWDEDNELKRRFQAECLIPQKVGVSSIRTIHVQNDTIQEKINDIIQKNFPNLSNIEVKINRPMFFS
jgi:hypothetical protein